MANELVGISAPTMEDLLNVDKSMTRNMEERPEDSMAMDDYFLRVRRPSEEERRVQA